MIHLGLPVPMSQKIGRFDKKVSQRRRFSEGNWKSVPTYNVCQLTTVYPIVTLMASMQPSLQNAVIKPVRFSKCGCKALHILISPQVTESLFIMTYKIKRIVTLLAASR